MRNNVKDLDLARKSILSNLTNERLEFRNKDNSKELLENCHSVDYLLKVKSNRVFIKLAYLIFYDREADQSGFNHLYSRLEKRQASREEIILNSFIKSEFFVKSSISGVELFVKQMERKIRFQKLPILGKIYKLFSSLRKIISYYQDHVNVIHDLYTKLDILESKNVDVLDYNSQLLRIQRDLLKSSDINTELIPQKIESAINSKFIEEFFIELSEKFRGSEQDILSRNQVYKEHIIEHVSTNASLPVLDIACGRGEMLEVVVECGFTSIGIDLNEELIKYCKSKGLNTYNTDAFEFLKQAKDNSFSAITTTHFVEHLEFDKLVELMQSSYRVLAHGGVLIVETPNPANLVVSAVQFYMDPTHRSPLPLVLTKLLMERIGFEVEEIDLMSRGIYESLGEVEHPQLNHMLNCPQDYALKGIKK